MRHRRGGPLRRFQGIGGIHLTARVVGIPCGNPVVVRSVHAFRSTRAVPLGNNGNGGDMDTPSGHIWVERTRLEAEGRYGRFLPFLKLARDDPVHM